MAKRFTDSNKWRDAWFMDLPNKYKLLWLFLLDECDVAGIWEVNWKIAQFFIGENFEPSEVLRYFSKRIEVSKDGKYWKIIKFIKFQQGSEDLNPQNMCHLGILKSIEKHGFPYINQRGLTAPSKGLNSPYGNSNSKSKSKGGVIGGEEFNSLWMQYPKKVGKKKAYGYFKRSVKTKEDLVLIQESLNKYLNTKRVKDGFIKDGERWFKSWKDWLEYEDPKTEKEKNNEQVEALLKD